MARKFVYVRHPEIVDADGKAVIGGPVTEQAAESVWKPRGYEVVDPEQVVAAVDPETGDDTQVVLADLDREQLRALATSRGVDYDGKTSKEKLIELLSATPTDAPA